MSQKTVTVYVIYFTFNRIKNYIISYTERKEDKRFLPFYHTDMSLAKPFESSELAFKFINRINNMHDRDFKVDPVEVPASAFSEN